jgi:rubrerythrin
MHVRSRRATIREVLDTALELERKTMQLYTTFVTVFRSDEEIRRFWFAMARHEAGHCGALTLVESLVDSDPSLVAERQVWFDETTVARLRTLLAAYLKEARGGVTIKRALAMALDIEASELEDVVVDLLQVVKDRRWRDQAVQMLIHDLSDLSFMIEKYTRDEILLARADDLVDQRVGGLRAAPRRHADVAPRRRGRQLRDETPTRGSRRKKAGQRAR